MTTVTDAAGAVNHIVGGEWPVMSSNTPIILLGDRLVFEEDGQGQIQKMIQKRNGATVAVYNTVAGSQNFESNVKTLGIGFKNDPIFFYLNFDYSGTTTSARFATERFDNANGFGVFIDLMSAGGHGNGDNAGGGPRTNG